MIEWAETKEDEVGGVREEHMFSRPKDCKEFSLD